MISETDCDGHVSFSIPLTTRLNPVTWGHEVDETVIHCNTCLIWSGHKKKCQFIIEMVLQSVPVAQIVLQKYIT